MAQGREEARTENAMIILMWSIHTSTWRRLNMKTERKKELEGIKIPPRDNSGTIPKADERMIGGGQSTYPQNPPWTNTTLEEIEDCAVLHYHVDEGYSASALVTMFGVGVLCGASLLAFLWTHLPWG